MLTLTIQKIYVRSCVISSLLLLCLMTNIIQAEAQKKKAKNVGFKTSQGFLLQINGYVQSRYQSIENDEQYTWVGRNDGFGMSNARLIIQAKRKKFGAYLSIEGARDRRQPDNRTQGQVRTMMLDAYLSYKVHNAFQIFAGQFKPAYDANELESTARLLFIDRALESRGVLGVEGINIAGLSVRRQIGLQLNGRIDFDKKDRFSLKYYFTMSNGNTSEESLNDNDSLSYTGRVLLKIKASPKVQIHFGGGTYYNEITEGQLPDLISEERQGYTADGKLNLYALKFRAQWMQQTTSFVDVPQEPERVAEGYHFAFGLDFGEFTKTLSGIIPAYRYAFYDPTKEVDSDDPTLNQSLEIDALTHHTIGLNILLNQMKIDAPLKIQFNYTWTQEDDARRSKNNRFDALMQLNF
jgi:hypothetical protein